MSLSTRAAPPLNAGDTLTRDEFLARWEAQPEIKFAELIGGLVFMPTRLIGFEHGDINAALCFWAGTYTASIPGVRGSSNATVLMLDDVAQPDMHLRVLAEYGGQTTVAGQLLQGAPELVAEVCDSGAAYDLHQRFDLYDKAGVREYVAVLIHEREVRWHRRHAERLRRLDVPADGIYRSTTFPGLWLDPSAFLNSDLKRVFDLVRQGLATTEHAEFVARLAAAGRP